MLVWRRSIQPSRSSLARIPVIVAMWVRVRRASSVGVCGPSWLTQSRMAKSLSLIPSFAPTARLLVANAAFSRRRAKMAAFVVRWPTACMPMKTSIAMKII